MEGEETFKVKLIFKEEQLEVPLNSKYDSFINMICDIMKISSDKIKEFLLSYKDSDDDNIIISSPEDYQIFFSQVTQKTVNSLEISIKEDSDIDHNQCFINFINYKDNLDAQNNNINPNNENNVNDNINENNNINYSQNNENKNINNNINENYPDLKESYNYNNEINDINNDVPIDDIVFDYKCSSCDVYPIVCKLYYCAKCAYYLCSECKQKNITHQHNLSEIESKEQLRIIKDIENEEIDIKQKEREKEIQMKNVLRQYNNQCMNINNNNKYPQNIGQNPNSHLQGKMEGNRMNYCINSNNNIPMNYQNHNYPNNRQYPQYPQYPHHNQYNQHQNNQGNYHNNNYNNNAPYNYQNNINYNQNFHCNNPNYNHQFNQQNPNYIHHNNNRQYNNQNRPFNQHNYQNYQLYYHKYYY